MITGMTPEGQAAADAYWAEVRAGLHKPTPHEFDETDVPHLAAMHRAIAMSCIRGAARHAQKANELAEAAQ